MVARSGAYARVYVPSPSVREAYHQRSVKNAAAATTLTAT
jgi:hypothetical protein